MPPSPQKKNKQKKKSDKKRLHAPKQQQRRALSQDAPTSTTTPGSPGAGDDASVGEELGYKIIGYQVEREATDGAGGVDASDDDGGNSSPTTHAGHAAPHGHVVDPAVLESSVYGRYAWLPPTATGESPGGLTPSPAGTLPCGADPAAASAAPPQHPHTARARTPSTSGGGGGSAVRHRRTSLSLDRARDTDLDATASTVPRDPSASAKSAAATHPHPHGFLRRVSARGMSPLAGTETSSAYGGGDTAVFEAPADAEVTIRAQRVVVDIEAQAGQATVARVERDAEAAPEAATRGADADLLARIRRLEDIALEVADRERRGGGAAAAGLSSEREEAVRQELRALTQLVQQQQQTRSPSPTALRFGDLSAVAGKEAAREPKRIPLTLTIDRRSSSAGSTVDSAPATAAAALQDPGTHVRGEVEEIKNLMRRNHASLTFARPQQHPHAVPLAAHPEGGNDTINHGVAGSGRTSPVKTPFLPPSALGSRGRSGEAYFDRQDLQREFDAIKEMIRRGRNRDDADGGGGGGSAPRDRTPVDAELTAADLQTSHPVREAAGGVGGWPTSAGGSSMGPRTHTPPLRGAAAPGGSVGGTSGSSLPGGVSSMLLARQASVDAELSMVNAMRRCMGGAATTPAAMTPQHALAGPPTGIGGHPHARRGSGGGSTAGREEAAGVSGIPVDARAPPVSEASTATTAAGTTTPPPQVPGRAPTQHIAEEAAQLKRDVEALEQEAALTQLKIKQHDLETSVRQQQQEITALRQQQHHTHHHRAPAPHAYDSEAPLSADHGAGGRPVHPHHHTDVPQRPIRSPTLPPAPAPAAAASGGAFEVYSRSGAGPETMVSPSLNYSLVSSATPRTVRVLTPSNPAPPAREAVPGVHDAAQPRRLNLTQDVDDDDDEEDAVSVSFEDTSHGAERLQADLQPPRRTVLLDVDANLHPVQRGKPQRLTTMEVENEVLRAEQETLKEDNRLLAEEMWLMAARGQPVRHSGGGGGGPAERELLEDNKLLASEVRRLSALLADIPHGSATAPPPAAYRRTHASPEGEISPRATRSDAIRWLETDNRALSEEVHRLHGVIDGLDASQARLLDAVTAGAGGVRNDCGDPVQRKSAQLQEILALGDSADDGFATARTGGSGSGNSSGVFRSSRPVVTPNVQEVMSRWRGQEDDGRHRAHVTATAGPPHAPHDVVAQLRRENEEAWAQVAQEREAYRTLLERVQTRGVDAAASLRHPHDQGRGAGRDAEARAPMTPALPAGSGGPPAAPPPADLGRGFSPPVRPAQPPAPHEQPQRAPAAMSSQPRADTPSQQQQPLSAAEREEHVQCVEAFANLAGYLAGRQRRRQRGDDDTATGADPRTVVAWVRDLGAELEAERGKHHRVQEEKETLAARLAEISIRCASLEQRTDATRETEASDAQRLREDLRAAQQRTETVVKNLNEALSARDADSAAREVVAKELAALRERYETATTQAAETIADLETKVVGLLTETRERQGRCDDLEAELERARKEARRESAARAEAEELAESLEGQVRQLKRKVADLVEAAADRDDVDARLADAERRAAARQAELTEVRAAHDTLVEENKQLVVIKDTITQKVEECVRESAASLAEIARLKEDAVERAKGEAALQVARDKLSRAETSLADRNMQLEEQRRQLAAVQRHADELADSMHAQTEELAALRRRDTVRDGEHREALGELGRLRAAAVALATAEGEVETLRARVNDLRKENHQLSLFKDQVGLLQAEADFTAGEHIQLKSHADAQAQQLQATRVAHNELQREVAALREELEAAGDARAVLGEAAVRSRALEEEVATLRGEVQKARDNCERCRCMKDVLDHRASELEAAREEIRSLREEELRSAQLRQQAVIDAQQQQIQDQQRMLETLERAQQQQQLLQQQPVHHSYQSQPSTPPAVHGSTAGPQASLSISPRRPPAGDPAAGPTPFDLPAGHMPPPVDVPPPRAPAVSDATAAGHAPPHDSAWARWANQQRPPGYRELSPDTPLTMPGTTTSPVSTSDSTATRQPTRVAASQAAHPHPFDRLLGGAGGNTGSLDHDVYAYSDASGGRRRKLSEHSQHKYVYIPE